VGTRLFITIFAGVVAVALFMNALHIVKLNERKMFTYFRTLLLHWFWGMSWGCTLVPNPVTKNLKQNGGS